MASLGGGIEIKLMSFNLRTSGPFTLDGRNNWKYRKASCCDVIHKYGPAVVGTQEGHKHQLDYICKMLPEYEWFGEIRNSFLDKFNGHERNGILYNADLLQLIDSGTFSLSHTPQVLGVKSSKPGLRNYFNPMDMPRVMTWGVFRVKESPDDEFLYINCHLDHLFSGNRLRQVEFAARAAVDISASVHGPCFVGGDFNAVRGTPEVEFLQDNKYMRFVDSWKASNVGADEGITYHEFQGDLYEPKGKDDSSQIDFMFYSHDCKWELVSCTVIKDPRKDRKELYPSDHFQLLAVYKFMPSETTGQKREYDHKYEPKD